SVVAILDCIAGGLDQQDRAVSVRVPGGNLFDPGAFRASVDTVTFAIPVDGPENVAGLFAVDPASPRYGLCDLLHGGGSCGVNDKKDSMEELKRDFSDKAVEDFRLIDEAVGGNDKAYAKLLQRYKRPVYHMILKMVRNADDAEDLTIESFAKAFLSLHRFKKDFSFSTWLFRIATNNTIDFIRKKKLNTLSIENTFTDDDGQSVSIDVE